MNCFHHRTDVCNLIICFEADDSSCLALHPGAVLSPLELQEECPHETITLHLS